MGGVHEFAGDHGARRDDAQQEDARGGGGEVGRRDDEFATLRRTRERAAEERATVERRNRDHGVRLGRVEEDAPGIGVQAQRDGRRRVTGARDARGGRVFQRKQQTLVGIDAAVAVEGCPLRIVHR